MADKNTKEMKRVRNYLRELKRSVRRDTYLASVAPRLEIRIEKWDKNGRAVLVHCYDTAVPATRYESNASKWDWVSTSADPRFMKWDLWRMVNDVVCDMRLREKNYD